MFFFFKDNFLILNITQIYSNINYLVAKLKLILFGNIWDIKQSIRNDK